MRAIARPARWAGPIVRPSLFRPEWADEGGPSTDKESAEWIRRSEVGGRAGGAVTNQRNDRPSSPHSQLSQKYL